MGAASQAKGRRLVVEVAEMLAVNLDLSILAEKPTKPHVSEAGAVYKGEGQEEADLRIRRGREPGSDLILLSNRARQAFAFESRPFCIECKNIESGWALDKGFWFGEIPKLLWDAWCQCKTNTPSDQLPLLLLHRNRWPILACLDWIPPVIPHASQPVLSTGTIVCEKKGKPPYVKTSRLNFGVVLHIFPFELLLRLIKNKALVFPPKASKTGGDQSR